MILWRLLRIRSVICVIPMMCIACAHSDRGKFQESTAVIKTIPPNQTMEIRTRYRKSLRGRIYSIPVLVLRGSNEEMGEAQGALAAKEIIDLLDNILIPAANKAQTDAWDTLLVPASRAYLFPERYERELDGLLLGIKKRYPSKCDRTLFSVNREISLDDLRALNCLVDIVYSGAGCSSFSAWGPLTEHGEVICGHNYDERYVAGKIPFMVLARVPTEPGRQSTIEISGPGAIGIGTAMSADGLTIMSHRERGLHPSASGPWQPRAIVLRDCIESTRASDSITEIGHFFEKRPVKLGCNTQIVLPKRVSSGSPLLFVVEWDGSQLNNGVTVTVEDPPSYSNAIVCTNHYVKRRPEGSNASQSSQKRFETLLEQLENCHTTKSVIDGAKAIKIMDSVSRNGKWVTYLSVIAFPIERKIAFAVSPGNGVSATRGEWIEITWDQIFGVL